ncbi:MAG: quaternary amine ABC transporter ATP-binding protein [Nocardioidaceae bacterium]
MNRPRDQACRRVVRPDEETVATVRAENVYKIFGRKPKEALRALQSGGSRDKLRAGGATPAVIDISFEAKSGETFVIMGLSGSGKSTLIRTINGLLPPTSGSVFVDEDEITRLSAKSLRSLRARKMSMVFQHFALFPHRTVLENAAYGLEVQRVATAEREERAARTLGLVGLAGWESSYPSELSGGMQQRVGLARALATDADVLLMDEAFSALDPLIRREMQDQLVELQHRLRKTIVFITHDLNEAMRLGDRVAMMRDGRIVQIGTAEDILNGPANDYVASFTQDVDRSRVLTASSVMEKPRVTGWGGDGPRAARRVMREHVVSALLVVDRDRRLIGAVTDDQITRALREENEQTLADLADSDVVTVTSESPVVELCAPAAESRLPLAVVDERRRLVGVVPRVTLLAALGTGDVKPREEAETSSAPSGESSDERQVTPDLDPEV